jgi:molybdopterin converting factor subunit 1
MSGKSNVSDRGGSINVRVLFFGAARDATGTGELQLALKSPATARVAYEELLTTFPDLRRFGRSLLLAVNHEYAPGDVEVRDGDELALFPPVSGGATDHTRYPQRGEQEAPQKAETQ